MSQTHDPLAARRRSSCPRPLAMRRRIQGAVALLVFTATSVVADTGGAQGIGTYTGVAAADAYRATVEIPGFLIVERFFDGGGPSAQAAVDSSGGSTAFAAAPDPGDLAVAAPGLISILTGIPFPFTVPVYVSSQHPTTPEDRIDQPGYHVVANSGPTRSTSSARFGERTDGVVGESFAESSVEILDDGTVVARSSSSVGLLRVGMLEIAGFRSIATVTRAPNEEPKRESSMEIGRITVAGIPLKYDSEGYTIGEQRSGDLLGPLVRDVFGAAGVTVEVLEPVENAEGIVAPGLRISTAYPVEQINSDAVVTVVLGQASAAATAQAFPLPQFDFGADLAGTTAPAPSDPVEPPVPVDAAGRDIPTGPASGGNSDVAAPAPGQPQPAVSISAAGPLRIEGTTFYLVLLGAAALLAVLSRAFTSTRRARWNS